jgi:hypothetical protein
MDQIEIFLIFNEVQIPFLSIPLSDIKRLAFSPFRWIRYVMFAICGSEGDLFESPDPKCPAVDYDRTELPENTYYYRPSGKLFFLCVRLLFSQCLDFSRKLCLCRPSRFQ